MLELEGTLQTSNTVKQNGLIQRELRCAAARTHYRHLYANQKNKNLIVFLELQLVELSLGYILNLFLNVGKFELRYACKRYLQKKCVLHLPCSPVGPVVRN